MRLLHLTVAILVSLALFAMPARGQGTSNLVPEPISTSDLHAYMRRYVQPTQTQWDAIEGLHDEYRASFKELRDNDIEKFLGLMRTFQSRGLPKKDEADRFFRESDRIHKRISDVDTALFEGIAVVMGEEKRQGVDRARDARARHRNLMGGMFGAGMAGGSVDVSEMAIDLFGEKDPAAIVAITPELISYESKCTSLSRVIGDESRGMFSKMFDELEKLGFSGMTQEEMMADPERMQQMTEAVQAAMASVTEKIQKKSLELRELNERTYKSISGSLASVEGDAARRLRLVYLAKAHPFVGADVWTERVLRTALRSSRLDDETKTRVRAELGTFIQSDDAIVDQMVKVSEEMQDSQRMFEFNGEAWEQFNTKMNELRGKRMELTARTLETLKSLITDSRYERIAAHAAKRAADLDPFDDDGDPEVEEAAATSTPGLAVPMDAAMGASSIGVAEMQAMIASMGIDAAQKGTLEAMHGDYLKTWEEQVRPMVDEATKAAQEMWTQSGGTSREAVTAQYDKRLAALRRNNEVDDAFLADVAAVLGDARATEIAVARLRRASEVDELLHRVDGGWGGIAFGSALTGAPVNVAELIEGDVMPEASRAAARAALATHVAEWVTQIRAIEIQYIEADRDRQILWARWQEQQPTGVDDADAGAAQVQLWKDNAAIDQRLREARERGAELHRKALAAVLEAVDAEHRDAIQLAYDRKSYSQIFNDARSATPYLERALEMMDLTDEQRKQVAALRDAYERDHVAACRRMIASNAASKPDAAPEEVYAELARVQNEREKVQFDRDERSARAVSELRRILTADQTKRIPGLAEYERNQANQGPGVRAVE